MVRPQKIFRIENFRPAAVDAKGSAAGTSDTAAILAELQALRRLIEPQEQISQRVVDAFQQELSNAQQMKAELESVHAAIERTKHEIATLHVSGFKGSQMVRVTGELDAIVQGTFDATDGILTAAENIDRSAGMLEAHCKNGQDRQLAADIQDQVIKLFEACNFQDLTGQRITKVVNTLKFIEDRIVRMMEIWGGIEKFQNVEIDIVAENEGDRALINGPKLAADLGHASQGDIDALFD